MSVSLLYFSVILFELHYGSFAVQLQSGQRMSLNVLAHTHCNVYVHTFPCDNILGEEGFPPPPPHPPPPPPRPLPEISVLQYTRSYL